METDIQEMNQSTNGYSSTVCSRMDTDWNS